MLHYDYVMNYWYNAERPGCQIDSCLPSKHGKTHSRVMSPLSHVGNTVAGLRTAVP